MMFCSTEAFNFCLSHQELFSNMASSGKEGFDLENLILTVAMVVLTACSTISAIFANSAAKKQVNREYFDKICGDDFKVSIKSFNGQFLLIERDLVAPEAMSREIETLIDRTKSILAENGLFTVCQNIEKMTSQGGGELSAINADLEDNLSLLLDTLQRAKAAGQIEPFYEQANVQTEEVSKTIKLLDKKYLEYRNNYKH